MKQLKITLTIFLTPYILLFSLAVIISIIGFIITMDVNVFNNTIDSLNPITHTSFRIFFSAWIFISLLLGYIFSN